MRWRGGRKSGTSLCGGGIRGEKRFLNGRGRQGQDGGALWARGALSGKQLRGGEGEVSALGLLLPPPAGRERGQPRGPERRRQRTAMGRQRERAGEEAAGEREGAGGMGKVSVKAGGGRCSPLRPLSFPSGKSDVGAGGAWGGRGWGRCPPL